MKNFKEIVVWKKGIELVKFTYELSKKFPDNEKYGIISQMTRSAVSIPANIAEGSGRNSDKDYARFLNISLGSSFELQTYFVIGKEMNWITEDDLVNAEKLADEVSKMLNGFIKTLKATS